MKRLIIFFGLFALGVWLFVDQVLTTGVETIWDAVKSVSIWSFGLYLIAFFINMCLHTLRWDIILHHHHQGEKIPFFRLWLHRVSAYAVSYLTPAALTGGEPVRIYFLQQDKVPLAEATSATVIDKILELSGLFVFIVAGGVFAILNGSFPDYGGTVIVGSAIGLFLLISWFYYATIKDIGFLSTILKGLGLTKVNQVKKFVKKVVKVENQMAHFYRGHWTQLALVIFITALTLAFMVFEHWLIAYYLGVFLDLKQSFVAGTIPGASYIIPIPGALGALEQTHAVVFSMLGVAINAFAFVLIIRLKDLVFVLIGMAHASTFGCKMIRDMLLDCEKEEKVRP